MWEKIELSTLGSLVAPSFSLTTCFKEFILLERCLHLGCQWQTFGRSPGEPESRHESQTWWLSADVLPDSPLEVVRLLFLRNHSSYLPEFVLILTTIKALSVSQSTDGSVALSTILINEIASWSLVPDRLGSSELGGVSVIASSPTRDQCQNLCSLLNCFVL